MGRLFSLDAATKSAEYFHYDEVTGQVTIEDLQDVTDLMDINQARRAERVKRSNSFRMQASVPLNIYMEKEKEFREKGIVGRDKARAWVRFLNDPDNRMFKTTDARI